ncbi:MAG: haloalkane dehalogenase [Actinobacteria bacterium]|nr:haloalkane dehalogenase [Actinomycetota bacterium]
MKALRTPDERFKDLPDYPFAPNYLDVSGLRMHYIDEGTPGSRPVLMLHGEPSWSYLYRKIIPKVVAAGARVIAPDLIGFGRSDKPAIREEYSYQSHIDWLGEFIDKLGLKWIILVCHDWGGLLGLRLAAEREASFDAIFATNTFLPTGDMPASAAFERWRSFSQETPNFDVGAIINRGCIVDLSVGEVAAYDAPFPDDTYKAGPRQFPILVPTATDDPAAPANRKAWEVLADWNKPFMTAFSDSDPITAGGDIFMQGAIPGARGQSHVTIPGAGHFIQEDNPDALAEAVCGFIQRIDA